MDVGELGKRAQAASRRLALASTENKNSVLQHAADLLEKRVGEILAANKLDLEQVQTEGADAGPRDRLILSESRLGAMTDGLRTIAGLPDPLGEIIEEWDRPNGLHIQKVRVPLGVVAIIYENRPNVTTDAAGLCLKSGNAVLLRGSGSALNTNRILVDIMREALRSAKLPEDAVGLVDDPRHETAIEIMQLNAYVDCLIPRGGHALIESIRKNATVPVIIDGDGNCHVYVDAVANLAMARLIVVNAKTQRTSVCNAAESLLIHESVAEEFLPAISSQLITEGVELVGDEQARDLVPEIRPATEDDFGQEFLKLKMSVAVVPNLASAIAHINRYGTGHTEVIVTNDKEAANRFTREVDAAAVIVNASTRFTDGERFGFGAEIGISTQKLHARGPMGLRELTTYKYIVTGDGQIVT